MPLRVLFDQNVPRAAVAYLLGRRPGWTVRHVGEAGLWGASDARILEWAQVDGSIIITFDEDFADARMFPVGSHCGVIRLRVWPTTIETTQAALDRVLAEVPDNVLRGSLVIVDESRIRRAIRHGYRDECNTIRGTPSQERPMHRRKFVAATALAAASAQAADTPVRTTPLKAGYWGPQFYDEKERAELLDVLDARSPFRWYGPQSPTKVLQFEKEFAARMASRFALGVTSGTAALQCALAAFEIGPGDEVILPAWTWHSCFNAVILAGALPVCAEIDETFNLDPEAVERLITPQTKLIMAVHLQGNPCHLDRILALAQRHKLRVLEDCAQSVGASYKGRPLGSHGDIGIYSLQMNKSITAGEGGALVTNDPLLFERAARFQDLGGFRAPHADAVGGAHLGWTFGANYRMNEFTGGVLLAQLRKLDRICQAVRHNAKQVYEGIRDLPGIKFRDRPDPAGELGAGVFLDFQTKARADKFLAAMKAENVLASKPGGSVILPTLPHIMEKRSPHPNWPSFQTARGKAIRYAPDTCPRTIDILQRYAGVLMDPKFTAADTADIVKAIRKVYQTV